MGKRTHQGDLQVAPVALPDYRSSATRYAQRKRDRAQGMMNALANYRAAMHAAQRCHATGHTRDGERWEARARGALHLYPYLRTALEGGE